MSGIESVPSAYLSIGFLAILGIIMPLTNFLITWVVRPKVDPARPHITKSYLLEGYEVDHSLYPRRLTTFECGSEPVGDAMIQFHFQYYWYAIIFLVFDVAFMFLGTWRDGCFRCHLGRCSRRCSAEKQRGNDVLAIFFSTCRLACGMCSGSEGAFTFEVNIMAERRKFCSFQQQGASGDGRRRHR